MNDSLLAGAIIGRQSRVRVLESQLVDRLKVLQASGVIDPEAADALASMAISAPHLMASGALEERDLQPLARAGGTGEREFGRRLTSGMQ